MHSLDQKNADWWTIETSGIDTAITNSDDIRSSHEVVIDDLLRLFFEEERAVDYMRRISTSLEEYNGP